jgi:anhydro-N-acetylmuramic acid kinase
MNSFKEIINHSYWLAEPRILAGFMTGTSADGIDCAIVRFSIDETGKHNQELLGWLSKPLPEGISNLIKEVAENGETADSISFLNFALSAFYTDTLKLLCKKINFPVEAIDAIGIHGQTVWHEPKGMRLAGFVFRSTLQLGSISALAQYLKKLVVGNFRHSDIAAGGEGAPLAPIYDFNFLKSADKPTIALNIGGMANITLLKPNSSEDDVIAFDTGCGNVLIDSAMQILFGKSYDKNGAIASDGQIDKAALKLLKSIKFVKQPPPKSTGRELFNSEMVLNAFKLITKNLNGTLTDEYKKDIITTLTYYTAWSIAENIRLFADENARIIVSGGGAKNKTLMKMLKKELPKAEIIISDDVGIPFQAKEAMIFAYLAWRTLGGLHGNIPSVTGAKEKVVLGEIAFPSINN